MAVMPAPRRFRQAKNRVSEMAMPRMPLAMTASQYLPGMPAGMSGMREQEQQREQQGHGQGGLVEVQCQRPDPVPGQLEKDDRSGPDHGAQQGHDLSQQVERHVFSLFFGKRPCRNRVF